MKELIERDVNRDNPGPAVDADGNIKTWPVRCCYEYGITRVADLVDEGAECKTPSCGKDDV